ncbi:beta-glucoside-specific PTS transporter subunit IIABC [Candidatus Stoquefichus massiliensis]|uniref:beta-glucoside-specific PTS transporter subunit IIABC n=1 Tax=Candidatus Stoquefichus massiliensis TaxID=1470350 RepID=UPI0004829774|nr:beta-glucoside-specific PTS transporter subunit IIABC [Candidatus Stoquefichus massiliensis]
MKNKDIAKKILNLVKEDNITYLTHCATRLRFNVKDEDIIDLNALSQIEGVLTAQFKNGQLQIVIGAKVEGVFDELMSMVDIDDHMTIEKHKKKKNIISSVVETIAGCFSPVIPVLIGCGMVKSVLSILTTFNIISTTSGEYQILSMIGDLLFYFFPFFLAVSAAKKFKTNEFLALALAGALMYPTIQNGAIHAAETGITSLHFLGLPALFVNYKSTIIPIIITVWMMSYIYRYVNKLIPDTFKVLFVPMIVLFIMVPLELIVIGPFGTYIGKGVAAFVTWLYGINGVLGAFLFGTFRPLLIILGMHYAITPINTQLIAEYGYSVISPANLTGNLAQAGACLAVFVLLKNKERKSGAFTSGLTAVFGITEPAMFGFNLKYKKPMICAMLAGGIGAAYMNYFGGGATAVILPGILALPTYIADHYIHVIIAVAISIVGAFVATLILGIHEESNSKVHQNEMVNEDIHAPVKGTVIELLKVNDDTFSKGLLGQGFAVIPEEGQYYAPFNGKVKMIFPTKHAIGLVSETGIEVLIHIGIDTVELNGQYFESHVKVDQEIKAGDLLITVDKESVEHLGYDMTTAVIITNSNQYQNIELKNIDNHLSLCVEA